jgi:hypothetical protein
VGGNGAHDVCPVGNARRRNTYDSIALTKAGTVGGRTPNDMPNTNPRAGSGVTVHG